MPKMMMMMMMMMMIKRSPRLLERESSRTLSCTKYVEANSKLKSIHTLLVNKLYRIFIVVRMIVDDEAGRMSVGVLYFRSLSRKSANTNTTQTIFILL
jgi:hypothetical protein